MKHLVTGRLHIHELLLFVFLSQVFCSLQASADTQPDHMLQIEYVYKDSLISAESFAAKPQKLWRAGTKYLAYLEAPDYENGIHGLVVTNEPDSWMVNL